MPEAGLRLRACGKALSDMLALKPYWEKPALRNFRKGDGKRRHHSKAGPRQRATRPPGFHVPLFGRPSLPTPGVFGSGSSCAVSIHPRLLLPMRQSRRHAATSRLRLYATPSLCGSASTTRETFPTFATVLSLHAADPTPVIHRALPLYSHDDSRLPRIISESPSTPPVSTSYH